MSEVAMDEREQAPRSEGKQDVLSRRRILQSAAIGVAGLAAAAGAPELTRAATRGAAAASPAAKSSLTWGIWGTPDQAAQFKAVATAFEQLHPGTTVQLQITASSGYDQKLLTQLAAGTVPDVFWCNVGTTVLYQVLGSGALLPIDRFVAGDHFDLGRFPRWALGQNRANGQLFGFPNSVNVYGLWYNKALFDAAGVAYPANWTWQEYLAAAEKLTVRSGSRVTQFGAADPGDWFAWVLSNGGNVFQGKTFALDQPSATAAIQWWADLQNKYHVAPNVAEASALGGNVALMQAGKGAMMTGARWVGFVVGTTPALKANLRVAVAPHATSPRVPGWGGATFISKNTPDPELAYQFLKYISVGSVWEQQQEVVAGAFVSDLGYYKHGAHLVSSIHVPNDQSVLFNELPHAYAYWLPPTSNTAAAAQINDLVQRAIQSIQLGRITAEAQMASIAPKINALLK